MSAHVTDEQRREAGCIGGQDGAVISGRAWHNQGRCTHTARYRPWRLHVVVEFSDESHAMRFEQYPQSGSGRAFAKRHFD